MLIVHKMMFFCAFLPVIACMHLGKCIGHTGSAAQGQWKHPPILLQASASHIHTCDYCAVRPVMWLQVSASHIHTCHYWAIRPVVWLQDSARPPKKENLHDNLLPLSIALRWQYLVYPKPFRMPPVPPRWSYTFCGTVAVLLLLYAPYGLWSWGTCAGVGANDMLADELILG